MDADPTIITVVGASGGVGATTLAAALTRRRSVRDSKCALIDLDIAAGGGDVSVGVEHRNGIRWLDLRDVEGGVDGWRIFEALPGIEGGRVLAAGGRGPLPRAEVPHRACLDVLRSLRRGGVPLVIDLPRGSGLLRPVCDLSDHVLLVSGLGVRALADLDALVEGLDLPGGEDTGERRPLPWVVTRGRRIQPEVIEAVEGHLGLIHLAHVTDNRRVATTAERGEWPGSSADGLRAVADVVLDRLGCGSGESSARRQAS